MSELADKERRAIKISDLSVGDWVQNNYGDYVKVAGIWQGSNLNYQVDILRDGRIGTIVPCNIHPIPITAEMLETNGFESSSSYWSIYKDNGDYIEIWRDGDKWYLSVNSVEYTLCDLHWVHQIQHLMRVWEIDKEINL